MGAKVGEIFSDYKLDTASFDRGIASANRKIVDHGRKFQQVARTSSDAMQRTSRNVRLPANSLGAVNQRLSTLQKRLQRVAVGSNSFKKISAQIDQTKRKLDSMNRSTRKTSGLLSGVGGASGGGLRGALMSLSAGGGPIAAAAVGIVAIGTAALAAAGKVLQLGGRMEQTRVTFKVLTGSIEQANQTIAELNELANATPFRNEEVLQAGRALIAFGESTKTVGNTLKVIGNISAATGKNFNELATIYGKARVAGRLFGEDINQLLEAGIPITAELAKVMGVTEAEVKKLVSEGKVGFKELQKAFANLGGEAGKFGGLMAEQSETLPGKLSTIAGNFENLVARIGEKITPLVKPFLDGIISILQKGQELLTFYEDIAKNFDSGTASMIKNLGMFLLNFQPVIAIVKILFKVMKSLWKGIKPLIEPVVVLLDTMAAEFKSLLVAIEPVIKPFIALKDAISKFFDTGSDFEGLGKIIKSVFVFTIINPMVIVIKTIRATIAAVNGLKKVFLDTAQVVITFGKAVATAFTFNLKKIIKAGKDVKNAVDNAKLSLNQYVDAIKKAAKQPVFGKKQRAQIVGLQKDIEKTKKKLGKKGLQEEAEKFRTIVQKWRDDFNAAANASGAAAKKSDAQWAKFARSVAENVKGLAGLFGGIANQIANLGVKAAEMSAEARSRANENITNSLDAVSQLIDQNLQREIEAFESAEDQKTAALQKAHEERQLIFDQEFQDRKAQLEEQLAAILEADQIDFENKKQLIIEGTANETLEKTNVSLLEEDLRLLNEKRQREHEKRLEELRKEVDGKKTAENDKFQQSTEDREVETERKRDELQAAREQKQKNFKKLIAFMDWATEAANLKTTGAARAQSAIVSGTVAAATTFGNTLASLSMIPVVGPFIALPVATALSAAVLAQSFQAANLARSASVPPPFSLLFAEGGAISTAGAGTAIRDEVPGLLARGEAVLDRRRTQNIVDFVDANTTGGNGGQTVIEEQTNIFNVESSEPDEVRREISEMMELKFSEERGQFGQR